jgi:uncharacterized protein (TIGR03067 family)
MDGVLKAVFLAKLRIAITTVIVALAVGAGTCLLCGTATLGAVPSGDDERGAGAEIRLSQPKRAAVHWETRANEPPKTLLPREKPPAPADEESRPTAATERTRLQGTWILVSSERNGQTTSEEKNRYTLTFTCDKWKVHRGAEVAVEGTLRLVDITAPPKTFDLIKLPGLSPKMTVDYGIYEWKDDLLRYCTRNGPLDAGRDLRPRDFTTRDGDGRVVYLWKRANPAANAPVEQPDWGKPLNGLRLGLHWANPKRDGQPRLTVVLDNVSNEDLVLNLGQSLAKGKKHELTTVLRLHLSDPDGRERLLLPQRPLRDDLRDGALVSPFVIQLVAGGR